MLRLTTILLFLSQITFGAVLNLETCRFRGEGDKTYLELYIELPRRSITFYSDSSGWLGAIECTAQIINGEDTVTVDEWKIDDFVNNPSEINNRQLIVDSRTYHLEPGSYHFNVLAKDSVSGNSWKSSESIEISPFHSDKLSLSDIELSTALIPHGLLPKFDRAGFGMVPGLQPILTSAKQFFFYYFEVYPQKEMDDGHLFHISRCILSSGDTLQILPSKTVSDVVGSFSDVDSVFVDLLPTGSYDFSVQAMDEHGFTVSNSAKFFIYRPDMALISTPDKIDSMAVETELQEIEFLLKRDNIKRVGNMTIHEKYAFLEAFWRLHDDDLSTPDVPLRHQFRDRVAEADARFGNSRSPGHMTNRGRIYVVYGDPDSRETHPLDLHAKPYEIWTYDNLEGGVEFVFADRSGLGEYSLIHSTKSGEVHNPDWYDRYILKSMMKSGR